MSAMTQPLPRRRPGALIVLALAVLLLALPLMKRGNHADVRHGDTAWSAWWKLADFDPNDDDPDNPRYWRGERADGRTVHILRLPKLPGHPVVWAVVVVGSGWWLVTAFFASSRKTVQRMKEECE